MENKKILIIALLFFVFVSCGAISNSVSAATPIYVNGALGSDTYDGTSATHDMGTIGPKKTIQNAINTVSDGGVVNVAQGIYNEHLTINKNLTINGASKTNTIIDGTHNGKIISISNKFVNINHLTLQNGKSSAGGAIHNEGRLTVNDCSFTSNTGNDGGAIYNYGRLTVTSSTFTSNTANYGGAIDNGGGSMLTIASSTFTSNTAYYGGAIYNYYSTLAVDSSNFNNNHAYNNGGAIYNNHGSAVIHSSHIIGNSIEEIGNNAGSVDARYNWWGSDTKPSSKVTSGVAVSPWLKSPKVTSTNPKNKAKKVSRTQTITIKFSNKIKASSAWSKIIVKKNGKKVSIKKWIKGNTIYIKTKKRTKNAYYTIILPKSAIKDNYGINQLAQYVFKFKTK